MASKVDAISLSVLPLGLIVITALVTPWNNLEPVGLPKLAALTVTVSLGGSLIMLFHKSTYRFPKVFFFSTLIALALSLLNVFINNQFISERVYGVQGRNFGALILVCLLLISIMSFSLSEKLNPKKILTAIKLSSFLVAIYFLAQLQGLDRAAWVDAYGGIPSSTLGNPNFVSAFVSIGFVSTLPLLLGRQTKMSIRTLIFLISAIEFYVSVESNSFQGLAIMLLGFFYVSMSFLKPFLLKRKKGYLAAFFSLVTLIASYFIYRFQDLLSINNATIQARLDYWEAGIAMGFNSPIFGKGFDFYGESYLRFRSERAAIRSPGLFTDSAHNYFIDIFAFGGFPLLICVLLPFLLVFHLKLKNLRQYFSLSMHSPIVEYVNRGLFIAWLGFIFQAMLSPLSIPLAYLGFLLTGFLYGHLSGTSELNENLPTSKLGRVSLRVSFPIFFFKRSLLRVLLAPVFILLPILGLQPIVIDAKFRDAIEQGNGDTLVEIALSQPKSFSRMHNAVELYTANSLEDLALKITKVMVTESPENIRGWRLLERASSSEIEKELARSKIRALDPKNPELNKD
jgi:hypothetical protein